MAEVAAPEPATAFDLSFGAAATTNYVFRGLTQSDDDPAIQGYVEASHGMFYGGVWASSIDFGPDAADVEIDVYAGMRPEIGDLSLDFGLIYYVYPDEVVDTDFLEVKASGSYDFGRVTLGGATFFAPDFLQSGTEGFYAEANAEVPLPRDFALSGALGHQWQGDVVGEDYLTWNIGASYTWKDTVTLDLRYHDTDLSGTEALVATISFDSNLSGLRRMIQR